MTEFDDDTIKVATYLAIIILAGFIGPYLIASRSKGLSQLNVIWLIIVGYFGASITSVNVVLLLDMMARNYGEGIELRTMTFSSVSVPMSIIIIGSFGLAITIGQVIWMVGEVIAENCRNKVVEFISRRRVFRASYDDNGYV